MVCISSLHRAVLRAFCEGPVAWCSLKHRIPSNTLLTEFDWYLVVSIFPQQPSLIAPRTENTSLQPSIDMMHDAGGDIFTRKGLIYWHGAGGGNETDGQYIRWSPAGWGCPLSMTPGCGEGIYRYLVWWLRCWPRVPANDRTPASGSSYLH